MRPIRLPRTGTSLGDTPIFSGTEGLPDNIAVVLVYAESEAAALVVALPEATRSQAGWLEDTTIPNTTAALTQVILTRTRRSRRGLAIFQADDSLPDPLPPGIRFVKLYARTDAINMAIGLPSVRSHVAHEINSSDSLKSLVDEYRPGPDDEPCEKALKTPIEAALSVLKAREAKILRLYYGLAGEEQMTLAQIGRRLGVTRERVRQIKERALARLRHVARARALEGFLGEGAQPDSGPNLRDAQHPERPGLGQRARNG